MAQKFDNGASFGTVREILNANADEINANKVEAQRFADSSNANSGRVRGRGNAILNRAANPATITSDDGGGIYWNNGVGLPTIRVLESGLPLKQLANTMTNAVGSGIIYMLNGRYGVGWKGDVSQIYLGYAIFNKGCIVAVDLETSKLWVCRQDNNYQWVTASADTSGIEAEITALQAAVAAAQSAADAAKSTASDAKNAATTLANGKTRGVVYGLYDDSPITTPTQLKQISFENGEGILTAPRVRKVPLSAFIKLINDAPFYGVYRLSGTYGGAWGPDGTVTGEGILYVFPYSCAIAIFSMASNSEMVGVFAFYADKWWRVQTEFAAVAAMAASVGASESVGVTDYWRQYAAAEAARVSEPAADADEKGDGD